MNDLLKLDELVCANPEEREKRRQTVKTIQSILDDVDRIGERLKQLQQSIAEEQRRRKAVEEEEEEERRKKEAQEQENERQHGLQQQLLQPLMIWLFDFS